MSDRAVLSGEDFHHPGAVLSLEIVEHDDVALLQSRQEIVFKLSLESLGVHSSIISSARDNASQVQAKDEGDRL